MIASVCSRHWLIPAYHAALDADIPNGHDDPLSFDPESVAESIEAVVKKMQPPDEMRAANRLYAAPATVDVRSRSIRQIGPGVMAEWQIVVGQLQLKDQRRFEQAWSLMLMAMSLSALVTPATAEGDSKTSDHSVIGSQEILRS